MLGNADRPWPSKPVGVGHLAQWMAGFLGELFVVSDCRVYSDDKPTSPKLLKAWQSIEHTSLEAKAGEAWVSSG